MRHRLPLPAKQTLGVPRPRRHTRTHKARLGAGLASVPSTAPRKIWRAGKHDHPNTSPRRLASTCYTTFSLACVSERLSSHRYL